MGKITGICISEKRGVQKHFIEEANIIKDWGIEEMLTVVNGIARLAFFPKKK